MDYKVKIIILGAAGDGRNAADIIEANITKLNKNWSFLGYLDDDPKKQNITINNHPVLGPFEKRRDYKDSKFYVSVGSASNYLNKKEIIENLKLSSGSYITLIDPDAHISNYAKIGVDCLVHVGNFIGANADIKSHVKMQPLSVIGHDSKIFDFCEINNKCSIAGNVVIEESCYVGMNVSIREGITVGEGSLIGMGTVVIKDVPPFSKVVGNPGRIIGNVKEDKKEDS